MIRVYIAASSPIVRAGLEAVVRASGSFELAGVTSLDQLEGRLDEVAAEVLLAEISHPEEDTVARVAQMPLPVVLLTDTAEAQVLAAALRLNVRAVLSVNASPAEIEAALASAAAGLIVLQLSAWQMLAAENKPKPIALEEPLSPRELEVLSMLAEGLSNKLIAHRLGISEHTVKFHVTSIMAKLGAGSRTDAVMQGMRRGLVML